MTSSSTFSWRAAAGALFVLGFAIACTAEQDLGSRPTEGTQPNDPGSQGGVPPGGEDLPDGMTGTSRDASRLNDASSGQDASHNTADATTGKDSSVGTNVVPNAKRVFETSKTFTGDLKTEGGGTTGPDGADKLCATAAAAASLGGTWKAWISSSTENAFARIADVSPWYFVDRKTKVFDNKNGLVQGSLKIGPLVNIDMNELGVQNSPVNSWTGTRVDGVPSPTVSPFNCKDWTNNQPINGYEGLVGIGISFNVSWWTDSSTNPCHLKNRLICFEQ